MNNLYHVVNNNIKNKNQYDDAIEYDPKFDNKFSLFSGPNMDPLKLVTFSLRGGNKHRETIISGPTCLWYSRATAIIIKRQHTRTL